MIVVPLMGARMDKIPRKKCLGEKDQSGLFDFKYWLQVHGLAKSEVSIRRLNSA